LDVKEPRSVNHSTLLYAHHFPYRSPLLGGLSALILVWDSPVLQGEIPVATGETLDQLAHQALCHLLAWGPIRPSVLAGVIGTGASNVSKIVGCLHREGLVERTTDEADRRACLITLTPRGEKAARGEYARSGRMIAEVLERWSLNDARRYTALSERFVTDALRSTTQMRERGLRP
jgi:DNA-binding MarR family transcriptional regulator